MRRGISIHFAVPEPGPTCTCANYGLDHSLASADIMAEIACDRGFSVRGPLVGNQVTRPVVKDLLSEAARELAGNGTLLVTFAGHGCREVRTAGGRGVRGYHESWCLSDGLLWDYDLRDVWPLLGSLRVVLVSESCYSQTIGSHRLHWKRMADWRARQVQALARDWNLTEDCATWIIPRQEDEDIEASVLVLGACREEQTARDGVFTRKLMEVWKSGDRGDYCGFMQRIKARIPGPQSPAMSFVGRPNPDLLLEEPFTV